MIMIVFAWYSEKKGRDDVNKEGTKLSFGIINANRSSIFYSNVLHKLKTYFNFLKIHLTILSDSIILSSNTILCIRYI